MANAVARAYSEAWRFDLFGGASAWFGGLNPPPKPNASYVPAHLRTRKLISNSPEEFVVESHCLATVFFGRPSTNSLYYYYPDVIVRPLSISYTFKVWLSYPTRIIHFLVQTLMRFNYRPTHGMLTE